MALAVAEVGARMAKRQPLIDQTVRRCQFCEAAGVSALMLHHRPLRDHYYCTGCGHVEVDWQAIYRRVESCILYEYPMAKARISALPVPPAARYDVPYVDGGLAVSQQESHVIQEQQDHWVTHLVEALFRCGLTREEKEVVVARYFERWPYRIIAKRMHLGESTVYERRESTLKQFARAAKWA